MSKEIVLYKGVECRIVWNYGNGYVEIAVGEDIILVEEAELTIPTLC